MSCFVFQLDDVPRWLALRRAAFVGSILSILAAPIGHSQVLWRLPDRAVEAEGVEEGH